MKRIVLFLTTLFVITTTCRAAEAREATEDVGVRYLEVIEAYQQLKSALPETADIVRSIQIGKNALALNLAHPKLDEARKLLARIDVAPKRVLISAIVSVTANDGTKKVISRPSIFTLEGQTADIDIPRMPSYDGQKMKVRFKVRSVSQTASSDKGTDK